MAEEVAAQSAEDLELLTEPVKPTYNKYSIITMQGMLAQIIMVVLEGVIMGIGLGAHGLACVSIIMSVEYINLSFGSLFGTGVPTVIGNRLGAGDRAGAQHAFSQGFWMTVYIAVAVALVFEIFPVQLAIFFGATEDILADSVIGIRAFGVFLAFTIIGQEISAVLRVDEKPQQSANLMTVSAIISIIWLAVSVLVLGMGTLGAGIYYGLTIGLWAIGIMYFVGDKATLKIETKDMVPDFAVWGEIFKIGFPFFVTQAGTFVYNVVAANTMGAVGGENASLYIGAFGVISGYIVYILMMFANVLTFGMQPIASTNNGAKKYDRLKEVLNWSTIMELVIVTVLAVLVFIFATPIANFFDGGDPVLTEAVVAAVRIFIPVAALGFLGAHIGSYLQCVEKIIPATIVSLLRYVILACPLMVLVGNAFGNITGVWFGLLAADILTGVICLIIVWRENKRLDSLC
ncbi:MAG: hypothetical protein K5859_04835 [Atopobiaceae bacterium]|nr:hypothetical protein [Atopobiaceae bacterium]